jgi:hypothetical protein
MKTEKEINAYYDGICEGIILYAHWKDGVQYVGTTGKTLTLALVEMDAERDRVLDERANLDD